MRGTSARRVVRQTLSARLHAPHASPSVGATCTRFGSQSVEPPRDNRPSCVPLRLGSAVAAARVGLSGAAERRAALRLAAASLAFANAALRTRCCRTPRSRRRPATAATVWWLQAQFGIVLPPPAGVCLRGRLSSNVLQHRTPALLSYRRRASYTAPRRQSSAQRSGVRPHSAHRWKQRGPYVVLSGCLKPATQRAPS